MSRLIVVANRLPVSVTRQDENLEYKSSPGGLASGLSSLEEPADRLWIGWPGITSEELNDEQRRQVVEKLAQDHCRTVFLSKQEIDDFYHGFSNKTIWPLFHYFPHLTDYNKRTWAAYQQVNAIFADAVREVARPGDTIWIHDYQLMLLPTLIRRALPEAAIGFFLHIPFPSFELFRLLPWRNEIIQGLLGADLLGFHTYDYVRHFLDSAGRLLGLEHTLADLRVDNRVIAVDAFPMGIDYEKYAAGAETPETQREIQEIREKIGPRQIILAVDRLDYTKGIIQRLEAFEQFLTENLDYKEKVSMIMLTIPSRTGVDDYMALKEQIESLVGRINGAHGTIGWMPVWYLFTSVPFERLVALYHVADVGLVTPLRDGMNLIAKEFLATKTDGRGVLILSEMAGAASELGEALIVNANDVDALVRAIKKSLEMPPAEQVQRNRLMQQRLSHYTVAHWARDFLGELEHIRRRQEQMHMRRQTPEQFQEMLDAYEKSSHRLLLLDYDGTIIGFAGRPEQAGPDPPLLELLENLTSDERNNVVIISGRNRHPLDEWLGHLKLSLVAEHGAWIKEKGSEWRTIEPLRSDWKDTIRPVMHLYVDRTPGSFVEEKDFSLVWHYRRSDPELANLRVRELKDALQNLTGNREIGVYEGNKVLEVKNVGVHKGRAALLWLENRTVEFILAAGDDFTDEDLFANLPPMAYSFKVGHQISCARFSLDSPAQLRELLQKLTRVYAESH